MKLSKALISTGIAVLAFASVAAAASFSTNLTVGSTGADVSALQNALIAAGYSIPSIQSGAATPGYFGSQTKTAAMSYQSAHGIPNTGFVGPLTRAALNSGASMTGGTSATCPAGYTCTANSVVTPVCPVGFTCTSNATGAPVAGTTAGITTPGVAGTLALSLWSTPSGVNVYKGQAYDVAAYKLQAAASDMAASQIALDFSDRLWLYANSITVKDETGAVVGQVNNLNSSNFTEITVGGDYRISVPLNNLVVKAAQTKYLTVNVGFNAISDRCSSTPCALTIIQAQVRAVDGTGVTDTETTPSASTRAFTYNGSTTGQLIVTSDASPVPTQLVQISTSVQTQNVLLGIFDIKSANEPSTLQTLAIQLHSTGNVNTLFNNVQVKINGLTYTGSVDTTSPNTTSSSTVTFSNMQVPLQADVYTPVSIYVTVAADSAGSLNGKAASTTIVAAGTAGGTSNNPSVVDTTYNNLDVTEVTITSNNQTFTTSGLTIPALSTAYGSKSCNTGVTVCNQDFSFVYSLTAGNSTVYVSTDAFVAISTSTNPSGVDITLKDFSDNNTNGDSASRFQVAPGQTKQFTVTYNASGTAAGGTLSATSLNYGTTDGGAYTTALINSDITNLLKAILFH